MEYQDFSFTKKSYLHRAQWRYCFYLSCVRIVVSPWLLTWLANYKRASRSGRFFCCYRIFPFLIRILTFWNRKYKYCCLYFSFISPLYPSFITFLWQIFCDRWPLKLHSQFCCFESESKKKSCLLCRNFISIYKINRTLHGRAGIRILSSRAESISRSFASLTRR